MTNNDNDNRKCSFCQSKDVREINNVLICGRCNAESTDGITWKRIVDIQYADELERLKELQSLVKEILNQVNDDHCWMDWGRTYKRLAKLCHMSEWKPKVLNKETMLKNCEHFIECLIKEEYYETPTVTRDEFNSKIKELEAQINELQRRVGQLDQDLMLIRPIKNEEALANKLDTKITETELPIVPPTVLLNSAPIHLIPKSFFKKYFRQS